MIGLGKGNGADKKSWEHSSLEFMWPGFLTRRLFPIPEDIDEDINFIKRSARYHVNYKSWILTLHVRIV